MSLRPGQSTLVLLTVVAVAVAGSAAVSGSFEPFHQPSGDEIIDRVEQRYESAETITGSAVVTVENESDATTATVEFAAAEENQSRLIVTRDETTYRVGSNGTVAWTVTPNGSAVWPVEALEEGHAPMTGQIGPNDAVPGDDRFSPQTTPVVNESNVSATLVGTPTVDGISTYEVELNHPAENGTTTLWVEQDDYRVIRAVTTDGSDRTVVDVQSTSFNVSIHESTFDPPAERIALSTFDRYDDFETVQSETDISLPRLDADLSEATVTVRQGETIVAQNYVLEGENVSVVSTTAGERFEAMTENATTTEVDGRTVDVATRDATAVAAWTEDGVTHAVIVEGSSERAVELADALSTEDDG